MDFLVMKWDSPYYSSNKTKSLFIKQKKENGVWGPYLPYTSYSELRVPDYPEAKGSKGLATYHSLFNLGVGLETRNGDVIYKDKEC